MGFTVTQAIAYIRSNLDEPTANRWTDDEIKDAIDGSLDYTLKEYAETGYTFLHETVSTTSSTAGIVDLSSYSPFKIEHVAIVTAGNYHPISRVTDAARGFKDDVARTIDLKILRGFTRSATDGDPLIEGAAGRNAISFERLVCLRAVRELLIKDRVDLRSLESAIEQYRDACFRYTGPHGGSPAVRSRGPGQWADRRGWTYDPVAEAIQIWKRR